MVENYGLHYLRTKEGREVDFALVLEGNIEKMIEVKTADSTPSPALIWFHKKYNHPAIQLVKSLRNEHENQGVQILKGAI